EVEHALERVAYHFDRFGPWPQPRHVDMRIAHDANVELLQPWSERFQLGMRLLERGVEASLIPMIQRRKINGLHRGVELLLAPGLSLLIGRNNGASGEQFRSQKTGARPRMRRFDRDLAMKKFGLRFVSRHHPRCDQESLAGLRVFG